MTEKDLRKLNRYQLLELLVVQTERADKLQQRLEEAERQLNEQNLQLTTLGSIAEASLVLKGVFQAAQDAADMYLEEAKKQADAIVAQARTQAAANEEESRVSYGKTYCKTRKSGDADNGHPEKRTEKRAL